MRKPFIAGNWKMNLGRDEALRLAEELRSAIGDVADRDVALFPTACSLVDLADVFRGSPLRVGAQDLHQEAGGAFTGEIAGPILKSCGAELVLVGHSERRRILGESDELVGKKLRAALQAGLEPVLCCGETLEERDAGRAESVVEAQVRAALRGVAEDELARVTIAYEPVWAIGTGKTATPDTAQASHAAIRRLVGSLYTAGAADRLRIQYGGSVKPDNVDELMAMPDVDGALVGGASLDARSFTRIVRFEKA